MVTRANMYFTLPAIAPITEIAIIPVPAIARTYAMTSFTTVMLSRAPAEREHRGHDDECGDHTRHLTDQGRRAEAADREVLADQQRAVADDGRQRAHEHRAAARAQ